MNWGFNDVQIGGGRPVPRTGFAAMIGAFSVDLNEQCCPHEPERATPQFDTDDEMPGLEICLFDNSSSNDDEYDSSSDNDEYEYDSSDDDEFPRRNSSCRR